MPQTDGAVPEVKMKIPKAVFPVVIAAALLAGGTTVGFPEQVSAGTSDETKKADAIRRKAQAKAKSNLGYPDVFDYVGRDNSDEGSGFYYLSRQIEQLSRYLRDVSRALHQPSLAPPLAGTGGGDVRSVYGPDGPTVKSVRLILEYRLLVAGNPRLKVGKVTEKDEAIRAQVVTVDGALVDEYDVFKKTGKWRAVRGGP